MDAIQILHKYQRFEVPEIVGVYLQNNDSMEPTTLKALGKGYIYLISDQGTTMRWETLYTLDGSGTVLSPDNYLQTHLNFYCAFHQSRNRDNNGSITFTDTNDKIIESVALERTNNGQWLTKPTNQILLPPKKQKYIIHKVRT